eukprot:TRINITY_DN6648_c0_g4_i1.p1 TRINITY_DN6648_c0_g4~~TRINITY_DN6648_c0_g4_i1.p1  ORF type:complete len:133 (-),score=12.34 TRINITY_DN6648_c0_g4_i1:120-518(-)
MGLQAGKKLVTGPKEAVSTVLRTVVDFVKDVSKFVRPPWRVSGPLSTPEYVDPTSYEEHYRPTSPGSIPVKPSIPNADPAHIYHISYYEVRPLFVPTVVEHHPLQFFTSKEFFQYETGQEFELLCIGWAWAF